MNLTLDMYEKCTSIGAIRTMTFFPLHLRIERNLLKGVRVFLNKILEVRVEKSLGTLHGRNEKQKKIEVGISF